MNDGSRTRFESDHNRLPGRLASITEVPRGIEPRQTPYERDMLPLASWYRSPARNRTPTLRATTGCHAVRPPASEDGGTRTRETCLGGRYVANYITSPSDARESDPVPLLPKQARCQYASVRCGFRESNPALDLGKVVSYRLNQTAYPARESNPARSAQEAAASLDACEAWTWRDSNPRCRYATPACYR